MCSQVCVQRPERSVGFQGGRVAGGCESPNVDWEPNLESLQKQYAVLKAEPSLQRPQLYFLNVSMLELGSSLVNVCGMTNH